MKEELRTDHFRPSLPTASSISVSGLALICLLGGSPPFASAETIDVIDPAQTTDWAPGAINHAQRMRRSRIPVRARKRRRPPFRSSRSIAIPADVSRRLRLALPRSPPTTRSSRTWARMGARVSLATNRKLAGPSARQAPARDSKPAPGRTRCFAWSTAPRVRATMSRRSRPSSRPISY